MGELIQFFATGEAEQIKYMIRDSETKSGRQKFGFANTVYHSVKSSMNKISSMKASMTSLIGSENTAFYVSEMRETIPGDRGDHHVRSSGFQTMNMTASEQGMLHDLQKMQEKVQSGLADVESNMSSMKTSFAEENTGLHVGEMRDARPGDNVDHQVQSSETMKMTAAERCILQEFQKMQEKMQSGLADVELRLAKRIDDNSNHLEKRIDYNSNHLEKRIAELDSRINSRITNIEQFMVSSRDSLAEVERGAAVKNDMQNLCILAPKEIQSPVARYEL